jgi:hypothetical protein
VLSVAFCNRYGECRGAHCSTIFFVHLLEVKSKGFTKMATSVSNQPKLKGLILIKITFMQYGMRTEQCYKTFSGGKSYYSFDLCYGQLVNWPTYELANLSNSQLMH